MGRVSFVTHSKILVCSCSWVGFAIKSQHHADADILFLRFSYHDSPSICNFFKDFFFLLRVVHHTIPIIMNRRSSCPSVRHVDYFASSFILDAVLVFAFPKCELFLPWSQCSPMPQNKNRKLAPTYILPRRNGAACIHNMKPHNMLHNNTTTRHKPQETHQTSWTLWRDCVIREEDPK